MLDMNVRNGSIITWRKPGRHEQTGRVEWVYTDPYSQQPYYRVRRDFGKRQLVYPEDIERVEKPRRRRK